MLRSLRTYFLFTLLVLSQSVLAQFPSLHFETINTSNGLSSNQVTCFYQDHEGFLWVGTTFGLNRFDGKNFQTFYHNADDANSISGNNIADVLQDRAGIFWIATKDGGLTRYDPSQPKAKQWKQFSNRPGDSTSIPTNRLNCLFDYSKDYLLVGAEVFPAIFVDKKNFKMKPWGFMPIDTLHPNQLFSPDGPRHDAKAGSWIHKIRERNDTLFIGFLTIAAVQMVLSDSLIWMPAIVDPNIKSQTPADFCLDGNKIWQANWTPGLYVQSPALAAKDVQLPEPPYRIHKDQNVFAVSSFSNINDVVTHVDLLNSEWLIVGTTSSGIYLVNKYTAEKISFAHRDDDLHSVASNAITAMFKDRSGTWWIGTKQGISKYTPQQWQFSEAPLPVQSNHELTIFSADEDEHGTLRVCTSDGIYKRNDGKKEFQLVTFSSDGKKLQPTFIYRYDSAHWVLGSELSFYSYNAASEKISKMPTAGEENFLSGNKLYNYYTYQIRDMVSDTLTHQPVLWYAPLGWGLGLYEIKDERHFDFLHIDALSSSIRNNLSRKVVLDKKEQVWVATSEGLYRWRRNDSLKNDFDFFLHQPGDSTSISSNDVTDVYVDSQNHLWITTNGGGLNEYDGSRFYSFHASLPASNSMYGLYPDRSNRFWIPSAAGFEVFDRAAQKFRHVDLPSANWLLKLPTKILTANDGTFYYGAGNSLISFHPDDFKFEETFPKIYLSEVQLFNQHYELPEATAFDFPYNKNYFTFSFSSLQLAAGSAVRYSYYLNGFDKTWSEASVEGKANYTNLPPGNYTFEVRATNQLGEWSKEQSLITFTIKSPIWECWWFYLMCLATIAAIVYIITITRIRNIMKIQGIRNRIANDLHDEVGSALSTISLYSQVAKMKANEQPALNNVLDKISNTSQEMQENMSYIVWSIQPRNDRFDQTVQRMKRYAIEMLQAKNMEVKFVFDENLSAVKLSQEKRKELFLIFKEAINNITKYANCTSVTILFKKEKGNMVMEIADNGIGFKREEVISGNGLHSMRERANALKGNIHITSLADNGTTIALTFPT